MPAALDVLLLEDNPADAELVLDELAHAGIEVTARRVASESDFRACLRAGQRLPDLILADFGLPQFDGLRALQIIQDAAPEIPFILVSGTIGEELAVRAIQQGAADYLLKDRLARLGPAVLRALEQKRLRGEQQQAVRQLHASEARHRALIEHSADAITLVSADGSVLYTSPATARILGGEPDSWLGGNWLNRVHPEDADRIAQVFGQLAQAPGAGARATFRYHRADGSWRWLEGAGTNLRDEPSVGAIVLNYRDVTDRMQAEAALAASESELRSLFAAMTDIVLVMNSEGRYLQIAPTNPALLAKPPAELLGRTLHEALPKAEADEILRSILRALELQQPMQVEYSLTIDHSRLWFEGTVSPMGPDRVIWIARDVTQRQQAEEQTRRHLARLSAQRNIDMAISSGFDLAVTLSTLLQEVVAQLGMDAADILLLDPASYMLHYVSGHGFRTNKLQGAQTHLGEGYAGRAVLERRLVAVPDLSAQENRPVRAAAFAAESFSAYFGMPLLAKGQVKGILEVFHRSPLEPDDQWLEFFKALAGQAAIAIDNAQLFSGLERSNMELRLAYDTTIEGWSRALDLRDKETEGHTQRVTEVTLRLAQAMGAPEEQLIHIRRGALLHDIGKMGVPDNILLKPGALTAAEWEIMRKHALHAYELLSPIPFLRLALDIPYAHHEQWDGSGYPRGLKGEQIPFTARIFAVVDVWDALRSDRPYRPAWPEEKVRAHIRALAGSHFDPRVVDAFLNLPG